MNPSVRHAGIEYDNNCFNLLVQEPDFLQKTINLQANVKQQQLFLCRVPVVQTPDVFRYSGSEQFSGFEQRYNPNRLPTPALKSHALREEKFDITSPEVRQDILELQ